MPPEWSWARRIRFAYSKLSLLNKILVCLALIGGLPSLTWLLSAFGNSLQSVKLGKSQGLTYSVTMEPLLYSNGIVNQGIEWKQSYRKYLLRVMHHSNQLEVSDLRFEADMPAGVVKAEIESQQGCEGLRLDYYDPSLEHGLIVQKPAQGIPKVTKAFTEFRNNISVTSPRLFPHGQFTLNLVLAYSESFPDMDGYLTSEYFLKTRSGALRRMKDKYKVVVVDSSTKKLTVHRNEGQHYKSYIFQPQSPLIFTDEGKVRVIEKE